MLQEQWKTYCYLLSHFTKRFRVMGLKFATGRGVSSTAPVLLCLLYKPVMWMRVAIGVGAALAVLALAWVVTRSSKSIGRSSVSWRDRLWWVVPLLLVILAAGVTVALKLPVPFVAVTETEPAAQVGGAGGSCSAAEAKTCGAADPVSDPAYNMKEIIKQSILLEEHLVEPPKRCKDCIVKHFLHIIGLGQEAQMLAGRKSYPMLDTTPAFYDQLYNRWLSRQDDDTTMREVEEKLRERRKEMVKKYILVNT